MKMMCKVKLVSVLAVFKVLSFRKQRQIAFSNQHAYVLVSG